jgi:prephenate dehydratase
VIFLGSYPRADKITTEHSKRYADDIFTDARAWLAEILGD